jgi:RNA polymerase sigma-70 factor (ECF subfamily)
MSLREKELSTGYQPGNRSAFDSLFRNYYAGLCSFAHIYVKSAYLAEEIVQEVFIKIWEKHDKINIHTSISAYLYRSVFNACMTFIKSSQESDFKHIDLDDASIRNELLSMDLADSEFSKIFAEDAERDLEAVISSLPEQCREIFMMCREDNQSYKEISNLLKVSKSTVKTQMSRAMNKIMKQMEKYF